MSKCAKDGKAVPMMRRYKWSFGCPRRRSCQYHHVSKSRLSPIAGVDRREEINRKRSSKVRSVTKTDDSNTTHPVPNRRKSLRKSTRSEIPYYAIAEVVPNFSDDHHAAIAEAAYFCAERRGFEPGHELEDWLAGEAEIREQLIRNGGQL